MAERLTLPEPARSILNRTHRILNEHLTPHTPGGSGWCIGGGTVLAARWRHRLSTDLDIQVHPHTEREHLGHKSNPELWRKLRNAGATSIDLEGTPTVRFREGRIELVEARPVPRVGDQFAILDSGPARVLSSGQILAGKLRHRGTRAPVRDLYDLAVAATTDPEAVAIAVNATDAGRLAASRTHWRDRQERYAREGVEQLQGVPDQHREAQANPAKHADAATSEATYHQILVEVSHGEVTVTTVNRRAAQERRYGSIAEMREGFERDGINAALWARGYNAGRTRNRCGNALQSGKDTTILRTGTSLPNDPRTPGDAPGPAGQSGSQTRTDGYRRRR